MNIPNKTFTGYWALLGKNWTVLWQHPIALFPAIYGLLVQLIFEIAGRAAENTSWMQSIEQGDTGLFLLLLGLALVLLIAIFLLSSHILAIKMVVMQALVSKKKTSIQQAFTQAKTLYWRVVRLGLAKLAIVFPLVIVLALLTMLFMTFLDRIFVVSLMSLVILIVILIVYVWFFFTETMLINTKKKTWELIQDNWQLLSQDAGHLWKTFLLFFAISFLGIGLSSALAEITQNTVLSFIGYLATLFVMILVPSWLGLFQYEAYYRRYGEEKKRRKRIGKVKKK